MWNVWISFSALSEMKSKIQTCIPTAVLTPRIVTKLIWCHGRRLVEPPLPQGCYLSSCCSECCWSSCSVPCEIWNECPMGHVGNRGCKYQPGCVALQLLPSVSQQLPSTPRAELGCSQDLALQRLFSVTILSSCQSAHREHKQEKGNRDF